MRFTIEHPQDVLRTRERQKDFDELIRKQISAFATFAFFVLVAINHQKWHNHLFEKIGGFASWAYSGCVFVIYAFCLIFVIAIPFLLLHSANTEPSRATSVRDGLKSYQAKITQFMSALIYPVLFYYGGHPKLAFWLAVSGLSVVTISMVLIRHGADMLEKLATKRP